MAESDLERFKRQANMVTDESLESTRRMVEMVEESQQAGNIIQTINQVLDEPSYLICIKLFGLLPMFSLCEKVATSTIF